MHTINVELPLTVSEEEAKVLLAMKLYEAGKLSLGQAARLAQLFKACVHGSLGPT